MCCAHGCECAMLLCLICAQFEVQILRHHERRPFKDDANYCLSCQDHGCDIYGVTCAVSCLCCRHQLCSGLSSPLGKGASVQVVSEGLLAVAAGCCPAYQRNVGPSSCWRDDDGRVPAASGRRRPGAKLGKEHVRQVTFLEGTKEVGNFVCRAPGSI